MSDDTKVIERLIADEPALLSSLDFGGWVEQGTGSGPTLLIGDQSEINLMPSERSSHLEHRMAHLAKPGDVVLLRHREPEFETYLAQFRGLPDITFLSAGDSALNPVVKQAFLTPALFERLVGTAQGAGGLTLNSYLTTEISWHLAQKIGETAKCIVNVRGPSPRISKRANDKLWFTRLARSVIGKTSVPPTMSAYGPDAAAAIVAQFGKSAKQVIVKVPDSAGSTGNIRFDSKFLNSKTPAQIRSVLQDQLHATGWADVYPILVGVWDQNVTCSPSVQLWIPRIADGPPRSHGVFEQQVIGDAGAFVGAIRSTLPHTMQTKLVGRAVRIAKVLQHLGYYGRCSFDAVICNSDNDPDTIHWIECNGRWTGVSIPLAVLQSIAPNQGPEGMLILQIPLPEIALSPSRAVAALQDILFHHSAPQNGVILLSPPYSPNGSIANLLVIGRDQSEAERLGHEAIQRMKAYRH